MSLARLAELERELAELQAEESAESSQSSCSGDHVGSAADSPLTSPWSRPDGEAAAGCRVVPTLARLCVDNIGTNMHLYACLEGLPDFITEQLLAQFERHFSARHSKLHDGNISNWLDLAMEKRGCQGLGQLTVLNLRWSGRGITDAAIEVVAARCPGLRELDLGFCAAVGDGALAAIARGCASLRNVDLTACAAVSDAGVRSLALRKSLQSLSLELTSVTDAGVQAAVRGLPRLRCLNLGGCRHLSNVGVQIVASHGARLVRLSLGGCGSLLDVDVADLAKTCLALQDLVLRSCARITDDAAKQIGLLLILFAMSVAAVVNLGHAPLPGASTFPLRARGPDKILHLRGWLEENGGNASGLTVAAHGGLLSTAVFEEGGVVAGVPLRMVMDDRTAVSELPNLFGEAAARSLAVEYADDPSLLLSLYLMAQRGMGGGSAWRHYGDILPQGRRGSSDLLSGFDNIPAFFNRSMLGLLRGSALESEAELQRRMLEHKWGRFCRSSAHASLCQEFDHTEFFWASTVVATRAFDLRGLLDHAVKAARGEAVEGVEARGATGSRWTGLVPLVDMANHDIAPNCGYRMDISACSRDDMASAERSAGCAVFQLVAKRRISSGEAVTVSYGSLDNFRSMVSYGFAQAKRHLGSFAFQFSDAPFSLALVQLGEDEDESGDGRIHGRMRWSADKTELLLDISSDGGRRGSNRKLFDDVAGDIFYRLKKSFLWFGGGVGQGGAVAELHSLDMMLYALTHFNSAGDDQEELSGSRRNTLLPSSPYLAEAAIPLRCDEVFGGSESIVGGLKPGMAVPILCLPNCAPDDEDYIVVWGDGRYSASSRICTAAQHHTGANGGTFLVKRHGRPAEVGVLGVFANGVSSGNITLNDPANFSIERLGDKEAGSPRQSTAPFAHFGARALRQAKATVQRLLKR